jgi:hypothetical protein
MHILNPMLNPWIMQQYNFQFLLGGKQMVKLKLKVKFTLEQATNS